MSKYVVSEPSALKFLKANGAVVDENGNVVNDESDYWKKVYDQAEPKVCKYLHADGTIDENPGSSSGADLEDNHQTTIDVSTYNAPVEVTPTQGKDGMKKVTVSLSNMPAGVTMLYAWSDTEGNVSWLDSNTSPIDKTAFENAKFLRFDYNAGTSVTEMHIELGSDIFGGDPFTFTKVSDTVFTINIDGQDIIITRNPAKDVEIWNAPPEVETTKQATIDVSAYDPANKPVITPTAGKQSMGSVEVTLTNIPSGDSTTLYSWTESSSPMSLNISHTPTLQDLNSGKVKILVYNISSQEFVKLTLLEFYETLQFDSVIETADGFELWFDTNQFIFYRNSSEDITLW